MAEYLALPSCIKLHMQRISAKEEGGRCVPRNSPFRATLRYFSLLTACVTLDSFFILYWSFHGCVDIAGIRKFE